MCSELLETGFGLKECFCKYNGFGCVDWDILKPDVFHEEEQNPVFLVVSQLGSAKFRGCRQWTGG